MLVGPFTKPLSDPRPESQDVAPPKVRSSIHADFEQNNHYEVQDDRRGPIFSSPAQQSGATRVGQGPRRDERGLHGEPDAGEAAADGARGHSHGGTVRV